MLVMCTSRFANPFEAVVHFGQAANSQWSTVPQVFYVAATASHPQSIAHTITHVGAPDYTCWLMFAVT